jgi:Tfp pilus assembly protein PilO
MNPNRRLAVIITVLVLVVGAGLVSGLLLPQWNRLGDLRQQESLALAKLEKLQRLIQRRPVIEQQYEAYVTYRSDEPDAMAQRVFLDELEQLSADGALQLNLKPKPTDAKAALDRVAVEVEVDATQEALVEFLDRLLVWPRLIEIERLRIAPSPSREYPLRASLVIHKVVIRGQAAASNR